MALTTLSSREFNQDISGAKKAAKRGPVIIAYRGSPTHVLLSIEQYQRLAGSQKTLREALSRSKGGDLEFSPPRLRGGFLTSSPP